MCMERPQIGGLEKSRVDTRALDEFGDARRGLERLVRQRAGTTEDRRPHNAETYSSRVMRLHLAKEHALSGAAPYGCGAARRAAARWPYALALPGQDHSFARGARALNRVLLSDQLDLAPLIFSRFIASPIRPATGDLADVGSILRAPSVDWARRTPPLGRAARMDAAAASIKTTAGIAC